MNRINTNEILSLIGNTPLIKIRRRFGKSCDIFVKMESYNPGGSIKDRAVLKILTAAEKNGLLNNGDTIIEATSGNTGIAAAMIGAVCDYRVKIVTHDKISKEKIALMQRYGADVIVTDSSLDPTHEMHFIKLAKSTAKEHGYFYIDQFNNELNRLAHFETTGPEIWRQTDGKVDLIVCGIGSGGTISGVAQYIKSKNKNVHVIAADPIGSIYYSNFKNESFSYDARWAIEGIGSNFIPNILDFSVIDDVFPVSDSDALGCSRLACEEFGLDVGMSSGAILHASIKCAENGEYKHIVAIAPDSSQRYLSKI